MAVDVDRVYARTREIRSTQPQHTQAVASNLKLLAILRAAGMPVAIASGSTPSSILPIMREHGIEAARAAGMRALRFYDNVTP